MFDDDLRYDGRPVSREVARATVMSRRGFVTTLTFAGGAIYLGSRKAVQATAQGTTTLTHWYHQYGEAGVEEAVMRYAQQYSESTQGAVIVEVVWLPGDYAPQINTALIGGEAPDVFELGGTPPIDQVNAGQLTPLDDLYTEEIRADFRPRDLESNTVNGSIYGIKKVVDTGVIYYRPSLLEGAGLQPPATVDELIAAAQALDTGRQKGLFLGNDGGISALRDMLIYSAGGSLVSPENQVVFATERTALAYEKLRELNETGALLIGSPTDWWDPSAFNQGLTAMAWGGLWAMPAIQEAHGEDFGVIPFPALDAEGSPATFLGGWSEHVNPASPNLDAAKQYAKYLWIDNAEIQTDFNLAYGFHVPPRLSVTETAEALQSGPAAEAVSILDQYARTAPSTFTPAMGTILLNALTTIVQDGAPALETLQTAQQECQAELDRVLA